GQARGAPVRAARGPGSRGARGLRARVRKRLAARRGRSQARRRAGRGPRARRHRRGRRDRPVALTRRTARARRPRPAPRSPHHRAPRRSRGSSPPVPQPLPDRNPMLVSLLRTRLRPYRTPIVLLLVLQLLATLASLYLPSLNADIIDQGVTQGDTAYIMRTGGLMLLVSLGQVVCAVAAVYFGARVAMSFGRDVRAGLFTNVQRFSAQEMGQFGAPSLITRTTNDVQQVQMLVLLSLTIMVMAPIMLMGGVVMALQENVELSGLLLVIVPVLGVSVGLIISRMVPYFRQMQKKIDGINAVLREQITGIRVIRAFVRERREAERFDGANDALFDVSLRAGKLMALMFPTVMLVMNASSVAVLWFGGRQIDAGAMEVGALTAFLSYLMYILMAVMMSTMMFMMVPRAAVSAERITDVLRTQATVVEP